MMKLWQAKRSACIMALSGALVVVGLGGVGLGLVGTAPPRAQVKQAVPSPVSGSCAPPCGGSLLQPALPLLRARQQAAVRLAAHLQAQRPPAPKLLAKPKPAPKPAPKLPTVTIDGHNYRVLRTLAMIASVYGHIEPGVGTITATGTHVHLGEVAVDPRVIPLDSWLYIEGYHSPYLPRGGMLAHAEDTGGAIKGMRVDIYVNAPEPSYADFGLQRVRVQVLAPAH